MNARERILTALGAEDGQLRKAGIELVVDHLLAKPLGSLVDVELVTQLITTALASGASERSVEQHFVPGIARVREALQASGERVGDALPASAKSTLERLVVNPKGPRFAWLRGALDRDSLRTLVAPALQELLVSFAARIPVGPRDGGGGGASAVAAAAGIAMRLGRGTGERLMSLGKSVADNLGLDLEARLRELARDYSQGAVTGLERAITARLETPEGMKLASALSRSVLEHILRTPMHVIVADLDRIPLADAFRLAPPILEHNLARELWRGIVESEVRAVLELEGKRTLGELLDDAKLRELVRESVVQRGDAVMRELFTSPAFASWLERVLAE